MKNKLTIGIVSVLIILLAYIFAGVTGTEDNIRYTKDPDLKFIVVGDPHIKAIKNNDTGAERLKHIVNLTNNMDIDLVVFMGDITNKGTRKQYDLIKDILKDMNKPYYVIIGNHDIMTSDNIFEEYYGDSQRIENIKGYQLLFIGTGGYRDESGNLTKLYWSFDFNKANKTIPTIIFSHTPIKCPLSVYITCKWNEEKLIYGKSMKPELDKFTNLLGIYSGHIHRDSNEIDNGIRYITINGLISIGIGGIYAQPSDMVGYSIIKDGKLYYELRPYIKE